MITAEEFVRELNGDEVKSNLKLGTVSTISSGKVRVTFDGENIASGKAYSRLNSYAPVAGDRVLLVKIGGTYVALGKIV